MYSLQEFKDEIKRGANLVVRHQKVAMLHPGRCGSTVLGNLMNQHSDIYWSGEPFERLMEVNHPLTLRETIKAIKRTENQRISKIYSFATKYLSDMHLSKDCINMDLSSYLKLLSSLGYDKYIVIDRSNHLKRAISIRKGIQFQQWHTKKSVENSDLVHIDVSKFQIGLDNYMSLIEYFRSLEKEKELVLSELENKDFLLLNYEDHVEKNPIDAYKIVCDYLNLNMEHVEVKLKRTNPFGVSQQVSNYKEVASALESSEFAWMLET